MAQPTIGDLLREKSSAKLVGAHFDALTPEMRLAEALSLDPRQQAQIWDVAADAEPIRLSHFVPDDLPPAVGVRHEGRNSLPIPPPFQGFQMFAKVFTKIPEDEDEIAGYNDSAAWFIHPGYFVAMETDVRPDWRTWGGVVIDYHRVPEPGVVLPEGWPPVVPNEVGLQKLVYFETRDFMRKVSQHVSIGRASKHEKWMDAWFVLCRKDVAPPTTTDDEE